MTVDESTPGFNLTHQQTDERRLVSREELATVIADHGDICSRMAIPECADAIFAALPQPATEPALDVESIAAILANPTIKIDGDLSWSDCHTLAKAIVDRLAAQPSAEILILYKGLTTEQLDTAIAIADLHNPYWRENK